MKFLKSLLYTVLLWLDAHEHLSNNGGVIWDLYGYTFESFPEVPWCDTVCRWPVGIGIGF